MIQICHITLKRDPFDQRIFHKECKGLRSRYAVTLLAPNARGSMVDGITISGYVYKPGRSFSNFISVMRAAFRQRATIYHIHEPLLLPLAWILRQRGKKIIYDVGGEQNLPLQPVLSPFRQILVRFFEKRVAMRGRLVLSERNLIGTYQAMAKSMCVVENFCDIEALRNYVVADRSECRRLFYLGPVGRRHGIGTMLEALNELRKRGLNTGLDLVGEIEPGLMEHLQSLPHFAQVKDHVILHDRLSMQDAGRIAQQGFAALFFHDPNVYHPEHYPPQLFDYMALGLPVVASNFMIYKGVLEHRECGICIANDDHMTIADTLEKIFTDKELQNRLAANGRAAVARNYNWTSEQNILLDFYDKVKN
jgi:glycosyltransferase involved in cell wall biosynthesis